MNSEEALVLVESALCHNPRYRARLNALQRIVFRSAWDDRSYGEIARQSGYELSYIKQTGSQLWQLLSRTFEEKVTKHNLQIVLQRRVVDRVERQSHSVSRSIASEVDAALFSSWLKPEHQLTVIPPETAVQPATAVQPTTAVQPATAVQPTAAVQPTTAVLPTTAVQPATAVQPTIAIPSETATQSEIAAAKVSEFEARKLAVLKLAVAQNVIEPEVIKSEVIEKKLNPEISRLAESAELAASVEPIDRSPTSLSAEPQIQRRQPRKPDCNWGSATDVSHFYGRETELALLEQWILRDRCRLVGLFGMGGIGKTSLSIKLAKQLSQSVNSEFSVVIWRSLRNAPPLADLLADLIQVLSKQQTPELADSNEARCTQLLQELRRSRCLIVLDNGETVMYRDPGDRSDYLPDYESYDLFWQRLGESEHQSTIVLTSREKPKRMAAHEGKLLPVRSLRLTGLAIESGQALFNLKGDFVATAADWQQLIEHYAGNPLALKMVAPVIQELFNGQVADFLACLQEGTSVFGDIQDLLAQQIEQLSPLERQVIDWLAIARKPITLPQLRSNFNPAIGLGDLLETLSALERRCLIDKTSGLRFTLQPVVMEYLTEQLIDRVCQEMSQWLDRASFHLILHTHALIQAKAKDYLRETQVRLILKPIADRLLTLRTQSDWLPQFQQVLTSIRAWPSSYMGGNLINLMVQMKIDLSGCNFSHLTVWNAYLRHVNLHRVNFSGADLSQSVFADTFSQLLAVAFSPDGKLATGDVNHEIQLWQVAEGKQILSCRIHEGWIWSVAFSPDGKLLASSANRAVHLWDVQTGACVQTLQGYADRVFSVAFSPEGQLLATGSEDDAVRIWRRTGELLHTLTGHQDEVRSVAFSSFSSFPLLASASYDQTVRLWHATTGECLQILQTTSPQAAVAFSPDGKTVASAGVNGVVTLWRTQTGEVFPFQIQHPQRIRSIAFSPDGQTIATAGEEATIRLWNYHTGICHRVLSGHTSWIAAIAFNSDHLIASVSEDRSVRLWDSQTGLCLRTMQGYSNGVWSIAFNAANTVLASGSQDRIVRLWRSTGELLGSMAGHTSWIWAVAFSPDQTTIASGSEDQTIRLWDVKTLKPVQILRGHRDAVLGLIYSPTGHCLWSGSLDGTIKRWNLQTGDCQHLAAHTGGVWSMALSSNGQYLISGSQDQTLRLWETASGKLLLTLSGHRSWIRSVAISPDQQTIVSGSADGLITFWHLDLNSETVQAHCERTIAAHSGPVLSIVFHPDGKTLATSSTDTLIKLWNRQTGLCEQILPGHDRWVKGLAYSQDGSVLASCSQDETIRLWQQNQTHRILRIPRPYEGMHLSGAKGLTIAQQNSLKLLGAEL